MNVAFPVGGQHNPRMPGREAALGPVTWFRPLTGGSTSSRPSSRRTNLRPAFGYRPCRRKIRSGTPSSSTAGRVNSSTLVLGAYGRLLHFPAGLHSRRTSCGVPIRSPGFFMATSNWLSVDADARI
jgi:hypothetical protein